MGSTRRAAGFPLFPTDVLVAIDRAFRLAHKRSLPAPLERWHRVRTEIYREIFSKFWNEPRRAFVQHENTTAMDASALMMPLVRFIGPKDRAGCRR